MAYMDLDVWKKVIEFDNPVTQFQCYITGTGTINIIAQLPVQQP